MTKKLSKLAIAELGITEIMAGKTYAYVGVLSGPTFGLGIAAANEPGYWPVPLWYAQADSYDEAHAMAEELNRDVLGLNDMAEARIICSSMAAGKINSRRK